jgi:hypothetical protein
MIVVIIVMKILYIVLKEHVPKIVFDVPIIGVFLQHGIVMVGSNKLILLI